MDCGLSLEQGTQLRDLRMFSTLPFLRLLAMTIALGFTGPLVWSQGAYDLQQQRQDRQVQEPPKQFVQTCTLCHGGDAKGTDRAPSLVNNADLRSMPDSAISDIIRKGKGGMPAFLLPPADIETLTRYVRFLNATNLETTVAGNAKAGESIFFGSGQCSTCHIARGSGSSQGPDLSSVAKRLTTAEMKQSLDDPGAHIATGYSMASVTLNNGSTLRGFIRAQGSHDLVLQASDGKLHLLLKSEYRDLIPDKLSAMPAFQGTKDQQRDLVAFLSRLNGIATGPLPESQMAVTQEDIDRISHPKKGDWPTYNGTLDGNRNSDLDQVNLKNVSKLQLQWTYSIPFFGLETTPIVVDGVMYVTGNNQVYALSGRTGREIWRYERPKSARATISSDAAIGVNRGVAVLGERVFYLTDDAHLLALDRLTGALLWDVYTPEETQRYGGTSAPLVVGNLVITGVSGADDGIRGFIAAYKATTGELAWRLWTVPKPGEAGSETWNGSALALGGGATWLSGSADTESDVLYWAVGNPHPDTDGDERLGSNLYTNSDLAIDVKTGKLLWHYQFTPHDLHDWDANEPIVLVNAKWKGKDRKLLLHANRNGFLYVLDRTTGKPLRAIRMVDKLNWASGISEEDWTPRLLPANETTEQGVKTCPSVRGATNWYSTAYNPATQLFYVMTVEDCGLYRKAQQGGFGRFVDPANPPQKILRAFNIETGKVGWQIVLPGPVQSNYSGVLSTSGGLLFFGESSGGFAAVDARTGRYLWHFETNRPIKASPMTYAIAGKQYIAIASGANILSFALPE
ncbi:MAG TPA: PQQ-binding-like beta-propeller repeat protein [Edaphobacter sp.]|jgi:PQQ-dependent dehydrogenase (methanol/ethanol family)|nr:PQQ-binding-like beta-propeller repeat protein [Edaphobacter sp.]